MSSACCNAIGSVVPIWTAAPAPASPVLSVFGRVGAVVAVAGDYNSSQVTNSSGVAGAFVTDALNNLSGQVTFAAVKAALAVASSSVDFNSQPITALSYSGVKLATNTAAGSLRVGENTMTVANAGNTGVGVHAGDAITSGGNNTLVGRSAGAVLTTGNQNTAIGEGAAPVLTTGSNNVGMGRDSLHSVVAGNFNTSLGDHAGSAVADRNDNLCLGRNSGTTLNSDFNICIGSGVVTPDPATGGQGNIGNVVYFDTTTKRFRVGTVGAGVLSAGLALASFVEAGADTVPPMAIQTLGANAGFSFFYVGTRNPNGLVSATAGSYYCRKSAAASELFINRSAADPGTTWTSVGAISNVVSSVFGRTGAVVAVGTDYSAFPLIYTGLGNTNATNIQLGTNTTPLVVFRQRNDGTLSLATETLTANTNPVFGSTSTWNAGAVTFTGWRLNVTNTASAVGSPLLDLAVGGVSRFVADVSGRVYGGALHNNAQAITGTTNQYIASGTYTPTLFNTTNLDASTAFQCQYLRVGNVVTVSGKVSVDPTAPGNTLLGISLPIASNLVNAEDCAGAAFATGIAGQGAAILADAVNDRASMQWVAVDVTNQDMFFTFSYEIL